MWMPIDLAVFGAGTTVGTVFGCAIRLALRTRSVPVNSTYDSKELAEFDTVDRAACGSVIARSAQSHSHEVSGHRARTASIV